MKFQILFASVVAASIALPVVAEAQGVPGGVAHGMYEGNRRAGPVGAIVGGAVGGVIGGVEGVLGIGPAYGTYSEPPPRVFCSALRCARSQLPAQRTFHGMSDCRVGPHFPFDLQAGPFLNDVVERGKRVVLRHGIAGIGDAGIPDGIAEIDVSERVRDAFVGDAHRLGSLLGRQGERGL